MNYNLLNILELNDNFCDCLIKLFILLGHFVNFIKILVPIIIILMGSIDLMKAVVAQKDDDMKKTQKMFVKRLIYGVALFFVIAIVQFLIGLVGGDTNNRCFKCVANVDGKECDKENLPVCRKNIIENEENPDTENEEDKDPEGWNCYDTAQTPVNGCRVHFSGSYISDGKIPVNGEGALSQGPVIFVNDFFVSDILGGGKYSDLEYSISRSLHHTLDSIAIDQNTKLIIYSDKNFKGDITLDKNGPVILYNRYRYYNENQIIMGQKEMIDKILYGTFSGEIAIFNSHKEISTWEMWNYEGNHGIGSAKICCKSN